MGLFKGMKQGRDALRAAASIQAGADPNDPDKNEMQDPVTGSAKVVEISGGSGESSGGRGPSQAMWAAGSMKLIVTADGVPATEVEWRGLIRCPYLPHSGQTIPITVDRTNPQNISIEWTELPAREIWQAQFQQGAQSFKQEAEKLKERRESGAITEAEFQQEKRRILRELRDVADW